MIFRNEHPNPQWEREGFINLNGEWDFDFSSEITEASNGKNQISKYKKS